MVVYSCDFSSPALPIPSFYLKQVLNHCPLAGALYMDLWERKNKENQFVIYRNEIEKEFLLTKSMFKKRLMDLVKEGLINVEERPKTYHIELVGWDEEELS